MKELLTGKCQNDFIYWYIGDYITKQEFDFSILINNKVLFNELPFSMQYGVYLEFFDSVGIYIQILYDEIDSWCYEIYTESNTYPERLQYDINNRHEAQQQAIIKANTIYNERH